MTHYNCDYLPHITFRIYLADFQLNTEFPSQFFFFFTVNSPRVTQNSVSQQNAFEKREREKKQNKTKTQKQKQTKKPRFFSLKTVGSNNSVSLPTISSFQGSEV